jgi:hypothetical protein
MRNLGKAAGIFLAAMEAIFVGTLLIAAFPWLATALPSWLGSR